MLGPIQHLKVMSATIFYANLPLVTEVEFGIGVHSVSSIHFGLIRFSLHKFWFTKKPWDHQIKQARSNST